MKELNPNFKTVELCLTYRCNLHCNNCSNLCTQAPFKGDLSVESVEYFLDDIQYSNIEQITLHGGEPVLNPQIFDIMHLLYRFRENHNIKLWLLSNNSNHEIRKRITRIENEFDIPLGIATKSDSIPNSYIPVNESPTDLNESFTFGCFQTSDCGICYNYLGYFPCSPMAASARVFGYEGCSSFYQLMNTYEIYFNTHCKHCGFAMPDRKRVTEQTNTQTWQNALDRYNNTSRKEEYEYACT